MFSQLRLVSPFHTQFFSWQTRILTRQAPHCVNKYFTVWHRHTVRHTHPYKVHDQMIPDLPYVNGYWKVHASLWDTRFTVRYTLHYEVHASLSGTRFTVRYTLQCEVHASLWGTRFTTRFTIHCEVHVSLWGTSFTVKYTLHVRYGL